MCCVRLLIAATLAAVAATQQVASDPEVHGPSLELVHLYYDEFPTGIVVSRTGRMFSNYPLGLDANNTKYQVAELISKTTETAYPDTTINSPPGGAINHTTYPPTGANYRDYFIGVQSILIDSLDRLWILDTGRALTTDGTLVGSSYGGPKLVAVNLTTDAVIRTYVFPPTVAYSDSYLNDARFDLRPNVTSSGQGIAYITDSSNEGRNGLVILDLGTGESWRHLNGHPSVRAVEQNFKAVWGEPVYSLPGPDQPFAHSSTGADGIAFANNGDTVFWSVTGSRYLYSIPAERLRDRSFTSEVMAQAAINNHGQKGATDGLMEDTNNYIYAGSFENHAINVYNANNATVTMYVRDPRIGWTDSMWVANDGYLYLLQNQLWRSPSYYHSMGPPSIDRRVRPFSVFRVPTADGGMRVSPMNLTIPATNSSARFQH